MRANLGLSRLIEMSVNRDSESFDSIRVFQISIRFRSDFYFTLYVLSDWLIGKLKQKMAGKEAAVLDYFSILMKYGPGLVLMFVSLHVTTIPIL